MLTDRRLIAGYAAAIVFLLWGTGVVSDDLYMLNAFAGYETWQQVLTPGGIVLTLPLQQWTHFWLFKAASYERLWPLLLAKTAYIVLAWWLIGRFLSLFMPLRTAWFASLLFLFLPMHDSTTYWFLAQHITLSFAFYAYAYHLAMAGLEGERTRESSAAPVASGTGVATSRRALLGAGLFALAGSFISYGSPPIAFALFVLALLHRRWGRALVLWAPNLLYIGYYLYQTRVAAAAPSRISGNLQPLVLFKQLILQVATFGDAVFGPSAWLKMGLGAMSVRWLEVLLVGALAVALWRRRRLIDEILPVALFNWRLGLACLVLAGGAVGMFAVTGAYPQLAFNLGNRTATYGCLVLAYLLVVGARGAVPRAVLLTGAAAVFLGTSAHWRNWHQHQGDVIRTMRASADLAALAPGTTVWVCGNQYSHLGPLAHIEFLSEHWVVNSCLQLAGHKQLVGKTLNRRFASDGQFVMDRKYNEKWPVTDPVVVYDSDTGRVQSLAPMALGALIPGLPVEFRHWVLLEPAAPVRRLALCLMPRLAYALGQ